MDCRVNLMKKKSVRLVLVGMCGVAGLLVTPAMRAESSLGESAVTMSADEAETGHPLEGFWKKTWIRKKGDSHKGSQPFVHYKYYGEDHMVSLSVRYVGTNDVDVDFEGLYTTFEYMSKKAIREGGGKLKIKTRAEDMFELSWTGRSPVGETDYEENTICHPHSHAAAVSDQSCADPRAVVRAVYAHSERNHHKLLERHSHHCRHQYHPRNLAERRDWLSGPAPAWTRGLYGGRRICGRHFHESCPGAGAFEIRQYGRCHSLYPAGAADQCGRCRYLRHSDRHPGAASARRLSGNYHAGLRRDHPRHPNEH